LRDRLVEHAEQMWPWDPTDLNTLLRVVADVANLSVAIYQAY
jgi:hypothetical protein